VKIEVHNTCSDFDSYRAARVKSLFNAETGANFDLTADLPIDDEDWSLGLVVGPSGSGKTSIGRMFWGGGAVADFDDGWPHDKPIIDAISPDGDFDKVTAALSSVGLGSVPTWLRPFNVISNGEKFRANLARVICEAPDRIVIDEFTSVVDRQVAKVGAGAFAKSWRRVANGNKKQCVLLSCHYDIVDWLEPDWVFDIATGKYAGRGLWRRPTIELEIWRTNWSYWKMFEPHHYLKANNMIAAEVFVATVDGVPVAHCAVSPRPGLVEWRMARIVVMPEWQGAGIGTRFITAICERNINGESRYKKPMATLVNTSHPGLCRYFRGDADWVQVSASMYGGNKVRDRLKIEGRGRKKGYSGTTGHGGHFRAIQGFRYLGKYSPRHKEKT
jgi:GNAT superfamily N-acetyltransferase